MRRQTHSQLVAGVGILSQDCGDLGMQQAQKHLLALVMRSWGSCCAEVCRGNVVATAEATRPLWKPHVRLHFQAVAMLLISWHPPRRGCLDIILLLLNVHFPLKNKELLSPVIYMETILLLAGNRKRSFPLFLFRVKKKKAHIEAMRMSYHTM